MAQSNVTFGNDPYVALAARRRSGDRMPVHIQETVRIQVDELGGNVPGHVKVTNRVQRAGHGRTR